MTDKILFYIDKAFVHFGIAKFIQEHYDCELYVLYDVNYRQKKNFQDQNIVKFKKEWFLQDNVVVQNHNPDLHFLKNFEKKYKINLWNLAYTERLFYKFNSYYKFNSEEILLILEQECKLLESMLDEVKPDFLSIRITDWHRNHLLVELCNAKNIPVLMLNPTRFGGRATITNDFDKINFKNVIGSNKKNNNELNEFLKKFDKRKDLDTLETRGTGIPINKKIILFFQFLNLLNKKHYKNFYENYGRTPFKVIFNESFFSFKKFYRNNFLKKNSTNVIKNEKFVYFPLQFEPERTISISSPFFNNQHEIITQIAKSLPIDYKLYVKEHPDMRLRGWRKASYYNQILELPNVVLVHPSVTTEEIMKKSSLVISISGTSGLEAQFYGIPSIVFSDLSYSCISSVYRANNFEDLPKLIKTALQKQVNATELSNYVNLIKEDSFEFNLTKIYNKIYKTFYHNKFFFDKEISIDKLNKFLEKNKDEFTLLAFEHIKKIKLFNDKKLNGVNDKIE